MSNNNAHYIFDGINTYHGTYPFRLELLRESGIYKLRPRILKDDGGHTTGSKYNISNDWHVIEIEWKQASASGANDGYLSLWIDGNLVGTISGVDNDAMINRLDEIRLGATSSVDSSTSGSMLFDHFESRRYSYIGPVPPPPTATPTAGPSPTPTITLTPSFTPTPTNTLPPSATLDIPIASADDDAEEDEGGSVYLDSSDLEMVYDGDNQQVGLRFTGVNIPQGATIVNAYVQFTVDEVNTGATNLTLHAEAINHAPIFTDEDDDISARTRTSNSVSWVPPAWSTVNQSGVDQRTPNLASLVQEVVNRPGWLVGNAVVILITGTGERVAYAYDGNPSKAARLVVEYTTATATPTSSTNTPSSTPTITNTPTLTPTVTNTPASSPTQTSTPTITPTPTATPSEVVFSNATFSYRWNGKSRG